MPKKSKLPYNGQPAKTTWHTMQLQQLHPNKFIGVVNSILSGRFMLFRDDMPKKRKPVR